ncbi:ABC transporter related protein [Desulfarculus baarsii DSM 2075]|uniref:ABC transporter related protein n=1 Tax=Desulfarculus baarsii (strain ATCC 33931 / DSM 2075 / LMG 7858 / VKM B-1802 / 2st14) TaxID=644282 RepID=E1QFV4_DESB2|nr:ATP-binding cassette domain-containing protein [Desulfarculus baarsii]ADK84564.1 ABC transporter related protein [Desulfarculus baarsii DSM 2075]
MRVNQLEILGGQDRDGRPEPLASLRLRPGLTVAVVGPTGSGKSQLLSDIEQLARGDTPSGRRVLLDGAQIDAPPTGLVATLSQRTNFVMDASVAKFIELHAACLDKSGGDWAERVLSLANTLCGEAFGGDSPLQGLSGGQTRALMIADLALISDAPVVLIDEVENAGIDKHRALAALAGHGKIVLTATHDPVLMLMNDLRVVMAGGAMQQAIAIDDDERLARQRLAELDATLLRARDLLRQGARLEKDSL